MKSVTSWPIPRSPTTEPSDPTDGWARTFRMRTVPSRPEDPVFGFEGAAGGRRFLHEQVHLLAVVRVDGVEVTASVPSNSKGSTPWIRWNSVLHCTAPVRRSHSQLPTWERASASCRRPSTSARDAWARRCSVTSRAMATTPQGSPSVLVRGQSDTHTGRGNPSLRRISLSKWMMRSPDMALATTDRSPART